MPLKSSEFVILAVLCEGEKHGNEIMQGVYRQTKGGLIVRSSRLYGVLRGLTNRGLIEPVKRPNDRPGAKGLRTYYRITQLGSQVIQGEIDLRARGGDVSGEW